MAMDQDQFARELEHALRRVRSTGDIELERPSRQRGSIRITVDPSTGQRNIRFAQPDNNDNPQRRLSTPATAHTRDTQLRSFTFPPLNADPPPPPPPNPPRAARRRAQRPVPPGFRGKVMVFFGLAGPNAKARSQLIAIVWKAVFGFVQYVVIITLLAIAAHRQSPTMPGISEWQACSKPLGAWDCIWLVRVALGCGMGYWDWRRNLALDRMERGGGASGHGDTEAQAGRASIGAASRRNTSNLTPSSNAQAQGQNSNNPQTETPLPYSHLFRRLNILTNTLSMVWFLAAHIFVYSSVNTCRHSSPHLWWITFGILCILYLMLLEIFLIGLLIFILGPILYLFYNIVLLCLGRHPLQHVGEVNADIKKIPKSVVDKIPLVLYIPPPPEEEEPPTKDGAGGITVPSPAHMYPPGSSSPTKPKEKRKFRFAFLRRSKASSSSSNSKSASTKKGGKGKTEGKDGDEEDEEAKTWEDNWVPGEYPFVRLEGNRAACAICLMDFDEPERKNKDKSKSANEVKGTTQEEQKVGAEEGAEAVGSSALDTIREEHNEIQETKTVPPEAQAQETQMQVGEVTPAEAQRLNLDLTLEDAGEGAQPLRLLGCGHVFHKTCVDPWLTDVSGRCPVCQRPVEVPDNAGKKKRRRGFGRRRNSS